MKARPLAPLALALSGCLGDASELERDRAQLEAQAAVGTIVGTNGVRCLGTVIAANLVLTARGCGGDGTLDAGITFDLPRPDGTVWTAKGEFAVADATANFASNLQAIILSADAPVEPVATNLAIGPDGIKVALDAGGAAISLDATGDLTRFDARIPFAEASLMVDTSNAEGLIFEATLGAPVLDAAGQVVGVISGNTINLLKTQSRVVDRALSSAQGHQGLLSGDLSIVDGKIAGTLLARVNGGDAQSVVAALQGDWGRWWRKSKTDRFVQADGGATFYFAPISILGVQPIDIDVTLSALTHLSATSQEFTVTLADDFEGTIKVLVDDLAGGGAQVQLTFVGVDENMFLWTTTGAHAALQAMFLGRDYDYGDGRMGRFSGLPGLIDYVEAAFSSALEP